MKLNVKLLTIAILALLLCATVPMAASAARTENPTTIRNAPVYLAADPDATGYASLTTTIVGKITFDTVTGKYSVRCTGLDPNDDYQIVLAGVQDPVLDPNGQPVPGVPGDGLVISWFQIYPSTTSEVYPNARGVLTDKGTWGGTQPSQIWYSYYEQAGNYFVCYDQWDA